MFNLDSTLRSFYIDEVAIPKLVRDMLRDARKSNEKRLENGLGKDGHPKPKRHVAQGSYKMKTVVQQPGNQYDIDNGVVFPYDSLLGKDGSEMNSLDARKMVRNALQHEKFKTAPEVRNHCVRVYYDAGYWVDVPVYRERTNADTKSTYLELASAEWKLSDPEGVTAWFQGREETLSPDADAGGDPQFRRIVAYVKGLSKTRKTWNWPTGFMISVLVSECYAADARDDIALRNTLKCIRDRLVAGSPIMHPKISGERLDNKGEPDPRCVEMHEKLGDLLEHLAVLDETNCDVDAAAKAWDKVYGVSYFRGKTQEAEKAALRFSATSSPAKFGRGDGGRYG